MSGSAAASAAASATASAAAPTAIRSRDHSHKPRRALVPPAAMSRILGIHASTYLGEHGTSFLAQACSTVRSRMPAYQLIDALRALSDETTTAAALLAEAHAPEGLLHPDPMKVHGAVQLVREVVQYCCRTGDLRAWKVWCTAPLWHVYTGELLLANGRAVFGQPDASHAILRKCFGLWLKAYRAARIYPGAWFVTDLLLCFVLYHPALLLQLIEAPEWGGLEEDCPSSWLTYEVQGEQASEKNPLCLVLRSGNHMFTLPEATSAHTELLCYCLERTTERAAWSAFQRMVWSALLWHLLRSEEAMIAWCGLAAAGRMEIDDSKHMMRSVLVMAQMPAQAERGEKGEGEGEGKGEDGVATHVERLPGLFAFVRHCPFLPQLLDDLLPGSRRNALYRQLAPGCQNKSAWWYPLFSADFAAQAPVWQTMVRLLEVLSERIDADHLSRDGYHVLLGLVHTAAFQFPDEVSRERVSALPLLEADGDARTLCYLFRSMYRLCEATAKPIDEFEAALDAESEFQKDLVVHSVSLDLVRAPWVLRFTPVDTNKTFLLLQRLGDALKDVVYQEETAEKERAANSLRVLTQLEWKWTVRLADSGALWLHLPELVALLRSTVNGRVPLTRLLVAAYDLREKFPELLPALTDQFQPNSAVDKLDESVLVECALKRGSCFEDTCMDLGPAVMWSPYIAGALAEQEALQECFPWTLRRLLFLGNRLELQALLALLKRYILPDWPSAHLLVGMRHMPNLDHFLALLPAVELLWRKAAECQAAGGVSECARRGLQLFAEMEVSGVFLRAHPSVARAVLGTDYVLRAAAPEEEGSKGEEEEEEEEEPRLFDRLFGCGVYEILKILQTLPQEQQSSMTLVERRTMLTTLFHRRANRGLFYGVYATKARFRRAFGKLYELLDFTEPAAIGRVPERLYTTPSLRMILTAPASSRPLSPEEDARITASVALNVHVLTVLANLIQMQGMRYLPLTAEAWTELVLSALQSPLLLMDAADGYHGLLTALEILCRAWPASARSALPGLVHSLVQQGKSETQIVPRALLCLFGACAGLLADLGAEARAALQDSIRAFVLSVGLGEQAFNPCEEPEFLFCGAAVQAAPQVTVSTLRALHTRLIACNALKKPATATTVLERLRQVLQEEGLAWTREAVLATVLVASHLRVSRHRLAEWLRVAERALQQAGVQEGANLTVELPISYDRGAQDLVDCAPAVSKALRELALVS